MARAVVSQRVKAVVLAGGEARWSGVPKGLLEINGTPLVLRILDALQSLPQIIQIAVVGPPSILRVLPDLPKPLFKVEAAFDLWTNTKLGIDALQPQPDDYFLLCAADMPFVTEKSLREFLNTSLATGADIVYLAVPISSLQRFFGLERIRRTRARLKEGVLTGGNLFLLRARVLPKVVAFADQAIRHRKSLWHLGKIAGWRILVKWVLSHLPLIGQFFLVSVDELVRRGEELLERPCKAIIADLPELAFDIDELSDYELAQKIVRQTEKRAHSRDRAVQ